MKLCVLREGEVCTGCRECDICDIDPQKICDNCCKCIDEDGEQEFAHIQVDDVVMEEQDDFTRAYFLQDELEEEGEDHLDTILYKQPDPTLLAEWEEKLRDMEDA